jgi:hypothetical protein
VERPVSEALTLLAIVVTGVSGVPGAFLSRRSQVGERIAPPSRGRLK